LRETGGARRQQHPREAQRQRRGTTEAQRQLRETDRARRQQHQSRTPLEAEESAQRQRRESARIGGRLRHFWKAWEERGANPTVVQWLRDGVELRQWRHGERRATERNAATTVFLDGKEAAADSAARRWLSASGIPTLQRQGILKEESGTAQQTAAGPFSNLVIVAKSAMKEGRPRPAADRFRTTVAMGWGRRWLVKRKFRTRVWQEMEATLEPGDWTWTADVVHAFYQVPLAASSRRATRFRVDGTTWFLAGVPMGSPLSPWILEKVLREATRMLRQAGVRTARYADNWLFAAKSQAEAARQRDQVVRPLLEALGLKTSGWHVEPAQNTEFLGLRVCTSGAPALRLTAKRRAIVMSALRRLSRAETMTTRQLAAISGVLIAARPAILRTRALTATIGAMIAKALAGAPGQNSVWRREQRVSSRTRRLAEETWRWARADTAESTPALPLTPQRPLATMYSDASSKGVGVVVQAAQRRTAIEWGRRRQGRETAHHINVAELQAMLEGVRTIVETTAGARGEVAIHTDSQVARAQATRGWSRATLAREAAGVATAADKVTRRATIRIWATLERANLIVRRVAWIPTESNPADRPSREFAAQEWTLRVEAAAAVEAQAIRLWGKAGGRVREKFGSRHASSATWPTRDWGSASVEWWCPPLALVTTAMTRLRRKVERAQVESREKRWVAVAPRWAGATWLSAVDAMATHKMNVGTTVEATRPMASCGRRAGTRGGPPIETWRTSAKIALGVWFFEGRR
jgi:ribonuclease HI